ncbi:MAG: Aspartokinase [uncultured Pyrinomonadaceae bacterium]|uniref:Aspartokinase n=1 Tax=uncultured Pyrinomonadaceae bacterium TaxID=2283094 RepID=A0A6J4P959_9BACT|nr:MAG: Aspartokinase [uncultured Pyrinomonadaceae bacterium]
MSERKIPTVMKFGGTSVQGAGEFARVAEIVSSEKENSPVVVTSAMAKVTDALLNAFEAAKKGEVAAAFESLQPHFERHTKVSEKLTGGAGRESFQTELDYAREELNDLLVRASRRSLPLAMLKDAVVSYGEQLSSRLLAEVLKAKNLNAHHADARRLIVTDDEYGSAQPIWDETERLIQLELQPLLNNGEIPVLGGFIAASRGGETTVLGRGGSDYSAALIGAALKAREIQIWTDVTGVLTCDPRICPEARTLKTLSYEEAAELAYFGAKVLHPKTIQPAVDRQISVRVCNSHQPNERGTMILPQAQTTRRKVKSIAYKKGITILHITSARMLGAYGFMSAIFQIFERHRTVIDVVTTSEVSVSLTLDNTDALEAVVRDLQRIGTVEIEPDQAVVCVVGSGLRDTSGVASQIFAAISDINVSLISHGASSVNMTFVVREAVVGEVIKRLHTEFFTN